ncbi:MAG: sigma 54-interacting transcriptional regulator [Pseudomonadota bacterium]
MKRVDRDPKKKSALLPDKPRASCPITALPPSLCCTILESVTEGIFMIGTDKKIRYFNAAAEAVTGFKNQEAIGEKCFDILRSSLCEKGCLLIKTLTTGNPQTSSQVFIIHKKGRQIPISLSTHLLKDRRGRVIGGLEIFRDHSDLENLRKEITRGFNFQDIIGRHPKMQEIMTFLPDVALSDSPVLIEGATGTGKELMARAIHSLSSRRTKPFVAVNCAALPDTLLESELFGYSKGAFTGALRNKPGRFLMADQGTLFLDEIANTSPAFQADLLRVLEDGEFTPLGDTRPRKTDFRILTASNVSLKKLVQERGFREDLYYRLKVVRIELPSLAERKEDLPLLIDHFIRKFNLIKGKNIQGVDGDALAFLSGYPFPGNIRELENIIEYAFISCKDPLIAKGHLPPDVFSPTSDLSTLSGQDLLEAQQLQEVLKFHGGNHLKAAQSLGISRTTLWRRLKRYHLFTS